MRIIKPGIIEDVVILFACGFCGCEWEEQKSACAYRPRVLMPSTLECVCPTCGRISCVRVPDILRKDGGE